MEKKLPSCSPAAYILVSKQMMGSPPNQSGPEQPGFFLFLRIFFYQCGQQMGLSFSLVITQTGFSARYNELIYNNTGMTAGVRYGRCAAEENYQSK